VTKGVGFVIMRIEEDRDAVRATFARRVAKALLDR